MLDTQAILHYLAFAYECKRGAPILWTGWKSDAASDLLINNDFDSCAILIMCYGRCVCEGQPCSFAIDNVEEIRRHMIREVMQCQLTHLPLNFSEVSHMTQVIFLWYYTYMLIWFTMPF